MADLSPNARSVVVIDRTPRCTSLGCNVTLRLRQSLAAGLCCCCDDRCDVEDYYVDLLTHPTAVSALTPKAAS
jgi:hypothetical protein